MQGRNDARRVAGLLGAIGAAMAAGAAAQPTGDAHWRYTVRPGDTLIGISSSWLREPARWSALQRLNAVREPRRLPVGSVLQIPLEWLRRSPASATVVSVVGGAWREAAGGPREALAAGAALAAGDRFGTGAGASLIVRFPDGSEVQVAPGSRLLVRELSQVAGAGSLDVRLQLEAGHAESRVRTEAPRPHYELRTPILTLGTRGTAFRAAIGGAADRGEVTAGAVDASASRGRSTPVLAGQGVTATPGGLSPPRPLPPAPDLSTAPALVERVPLRLAWRGDAAAAGWRAQVRSAPDGRVLLLDGRFDGPLATWPDLPDGDYVLRVRATDADGLEGRDADHPFRLKARPEPPPLLAPAPDARLYGDRVAWRWARPEGVARYGFQVAADGAFARPLIDRPDLEQPGLELPLPPGTWHWRVRSVRPGNDPGPWGDAQRFELSPEPPAPVADAAEVADGRLTLRWPRREAGDRFRVQLARDAGFTELLLDREQSEVSIGVADLPVGEVHFRLRTITADGHAGPWGTPSRVEVPASRAWLWFVPAALLLLLL